LKTLSIKWKVALGATALSIALIGMVSAIQVSFLRRDIADVLSAQQFTLASQVAHDLDGKLAASLNALAKSAESLPHDIVSDPDRVRIFYAQRPAMFVVFDDILLIGTDGQVTADYPQIPGRPNINVADGRYFQQVMATGKPVISAPALSKLRHEPIIKMAAPVLAADGRVLAVLTGVLRLQKENFLGHLSSTTVGKTGYFAILTRGLEPVYVVHPDRERILKSRPPGANPATTRALEGFEGTVEGTNSDGVRALISYKTLRTTDWLLTVTLPVDEAFAPIASAERRTFVVAMIVALLVTPLVWFLAWRLLAPLSRLLDSIRQLRSAPGGFSAVEVMRRDEIGDLAQAFNLLMEERAVAESQQRDSERRIRTITDNLPALVCYIDREHRFRFNNHTYERWLDRPLKEITGRTLSDVYGEALYARLRPHIEKALAGEKAKFELEFDARDGTIHHAQGTYIPHRSEDGSVAGIYGLITDVTKVKQTERKLRGLLEAAPDAMVVVNQGGEIVLLNVQAEKQFGYHRDELLGQAVKNIVPQGFAERLLADGLQSAEVALAQQIGMGIELTGRRKDGSEFPIEIMLSPLESAEGILVTAAIRDISVRKEAEGRIVHLSRVYAMLSGINTLIVRVRDRDELFREACRLAVEGGGFSMALIGIVDRSAMQLVPVAWAGKDEELMTSIREILSSSEGARSTMIAQAIRQKQAVVSNDSQSDSRLLFGKQYTESGVRSIAILPLIVADEAVGVLALYASESEFFHQEEMKLLADLAGDIAFAIDHIEKGEKLNYLAYYDVLTGLANRSLFLERVAQYMRSAVSGGHKLALLVIDLERFKNINDSLGQAAGDALLQQVAQWLTRNAGDVNLLARLGADHFAAVLPEVRQDGDLARLLEKTMAAFLDHPFQLNDSIFRVAVKVGVALFPDDGHDADTLFKNAESALKKAKASGERYLLYTQKMTATVSVKLTLENQLRQALDKEEFVLHYQPKVNLASGKLVGAEALIRWNDPRTGLVPPGRFIPVLEETGLIYEVGRWALRKAIEDYLRWRSAGLAAVRIAVNVSPLQLRNRGFIDEIQQAIGIDTHAAAGLELEITESVIMDDVKHSTATLQAIRAMGVTIAIDDFGTGFSSLGSLAKLPVDTLKVDRSFVIDMTAGPQGLALVSTIINLAHALKLKVVAEGVETEEQSRLLLLLNCDEMQGFLFSKPVPSEIFETKYLAVPPKIGSR